MTAQAPLADFRCRHPLRVRWSEVDPQQLVFNPNYLVYADLAVTEYWRHVGLPYPGVVRAFGGDIFLRHAQVDFQAPARFDEQLLVGARCARMGRSSLSFEVAVFRGEQEVNRMQLIYVYADPASHKSAALPTNLRALVQAYEDGEPFCTVQIGPWDESEPGLKAVRAEVFIAEQRVPVEMEWDEWDARSLHARVTHRLGPVIATGRLLPSQAGHSKLGRMAVLRAYRGLGLGASVLKALIETARQRGDAHLLLHAQINAQRFYERFGFAAVGEPFDEAGIAHIKMHLALTA